MRDVIRFGLAGWLILLLSSVSGFAIYAALFTRPDLETPWVGQLLYRLGQALIAVAILLLLGGGLGAGFMTVRWALGGS